jgi:hypothetical protein
MPDGGGERGQHKKSGGENKIDKVKKEELLKVKVKR